MMNFFADYNSDNPVPGGRRYDALSESWPSLTFTDSFSSSISEQSFPFHSSNSDDCYRMCFFYGGECGVSSINVQAVEVFELVFFSFNFISKKKSIP